MGTKVFITSEETRQRVQMRHQNPKMQGSVRLRDVVVDRVELQGMRSSGSTSICTDTLPITCEESQAAGHAPSIENAAFGAAQSPVEARKLSVRHAALLACAAGSSLLTCWWIVAGRNSLGQAMMVSPEIQRALSLFWVEALQGGLSGAAAMVGIFVFSLQLVS